MEQMSINTDSIDSDQLLNEGSTADGENANSNILAFPSTEVQSSDNRPEINLSDRQQREIYTDCEKVMLDSTNPTLYRMGDLLIYLDKNDDGNEKAKRIHVNNLLKLLIDQANFVKNSTNTINGCVPATLPKNVPSVLLDNLNSCIPEIKMISSHPLLTHDGALHFNPGYNPEAKAFIRQRGGYVDALPPLEEAKNILRDVFCDFPFESDSDYANLIAALLQQIVRLSIDSTTPLFGIEASTIGSGKTFLANIISHIIFGKDPKTISLPNSDDEVRRLITSVLMEASECVLLDNCNKIDSKSIAAVLTSKVWQDRLLRTNTTSDFPNNALWISTGNNPVLSPEIARRYIPIRLRPRKEQPWAQATSTYRYPNLKNHVKSIRQELLGALLSLIDNWIKKGSPKGSYPLGSYEEWSETIGGILDCASIPGFLENRTKMFERNNEDTAKMRALFNLWFKEYGQKELHVTEILKLCNSNGLLWEEISGGNERSQATRLGRKLKEATGKCFGDFILNSKPDKHTGSNQYYLEKIGK